MVESTGSGITKIGQIAINAKDIDRATAFYRDTLGLKFLFPAPKMAFFQLGELMLMLSLPETEEYDHASSVLYFQVDDIEAAHRELAAKGVDFRDTPHLIYSAPTHDLWMTFFRDSEGNTLALQSHKPRL